MSKVQNLISAAGLVQKTFKVDENFSAGTVGAALLAGNGKIYTGICLDLACGLGFCAEHAAIAEMIKDQETQIQMIVAVKNSVVLSPCGKCRELIVQLNKYNAETQIILSANKTVPLKELLPEHWLNLAKVLPQELGGPKGPEPTRYGDWEVKGRVSDF